GRTRGRRDANKDVRGTLTKSRVVGADERVAYCRERRVSSVSGTKGVPELDGRVGDRRARPSRFLRVRLACHNIRGFPPNPPPAGAEGLFSHRRFFPNSPPSPGQLFCRYKEVPPNAPRSPPC